MFDKGYRVTVLSDIIEEGSSEIVIFRNHLVYQCRLDATMELYFVCIFLYFKRYLIISSNFMTISLNLEIY